MTDATGESTAGLMAQLRSATREHHRRAEGRELQQEMVRGTLPRAYFAAYLGELLHVHRGLETLLERVAAEQPAVAAVYRAHHARRDDLRADLEFHGHEPWPPTAATRRLLAELDRWAEEQPLALLGPLYVLEGSMNGNKFIARALMRAWSLGPERGFRYLDPYGEEQPAKWAAFRADIDAQAFGAAEQAEIIAAAQRTFDGLGAIADAVHAAASRPAAGEGGPVAHPSGQ